MNFYDYFDISETIEKPCLLAAQTLLAAGFEVIALKEGTREPLGDSRFKDLSRLRATPLKDTEIIKFFGSEYYDFKNNKQYGFPDIAIMLRRNMEVIDVDDKNKPGIAKVFISELELANPELFDKLIISKTPHAGLHLLYYSEMIGGDSVLARVDASPHPLAIIERLNETHKNYIKCSPSKGYEFIKGNPLEIKTLSADERQWLSAFCTSFNKLVIPEVSEVESQREDSPWKVFNATHDYKYTLNELLERGWTVQMELTESIRLMRPCGLQLSASLFKDTNSLYLYTTSSDLKPEKGYSPFGIYAHYYHDDNIVLACRQLEKEGCGKNIFDEGKFWKKAKSKISIKYTELSQWLYNLGYRIYENEIVKITENIITIIKDRDLKAAFIRELEPFIVDEFYEKVGKIFSPDGGIMAMLECLEDKFINDTPTETWLFFQNYAVKITGSEILPLQYKDVPGYIWHDKVVKRNFYNDTFKGCVAEKYVKILGGIEYERLCKIMGYSLNRYKDKTNARCPIITEDIDPKSEGESVGRSGKGLLFSFIAQYRKSCYFDGKNFSFDKTHLWQNVDLDTDIIYIDDPLPTFKFDRLFSVITESIQVDKKNKQQLIIPFNKSPKFYINSNFTLGKSDDSYAGRQLKFPIVKYFSAFYTPLDEFKHMFFDDWDKAEFCKFDNFMAFCAQSYLADINHKDLTFVSINSKERQLISETNKDFIDYMDSQMANCFFDFAPQCLKNYSGPMGDYFVTNGVNYNQWLANMSAKKPDKEFFILIDKDLIFAKAIEKTKLKNLKLYTVTSWLKVWCANRGVSVDTRFQTVEGRINKILDFPFKNSDAIPTTSPDMPF